MVEKASQTLHVDRLRQRGGFAASQEPAQQWERRPQRPQRPRRASPQNRRATGANRKTDISLTKGQNEILMFSNILKRDELAFSEIA